MIEKYSADGVRVGMLLSSPAGNDLLFDESLCDQGSKFSNKIWNAFRLIKGWEISDEVEVDEAAEQANIWFSDVFNSALQEINDNYNKFRMSDALMSTYKLTWDEFCGWYLEMVKPAYQQPLARRIYEQIISHLENVLRVVNPFMPFITEEIWQNINEGERRESLMINQWPTANETEKVVKEFEAVKSLISEIRTIRKEKKIAFKEQLELKVKQEDKKSNRFDSVVEKLTNLSSIESVSEKVEGSVSFVVNKTEYFIPLAGAIDVEVEKKKIEEEIAYNRGFLKSVEKKLSNERFVNNAPEAVVAVEKKKKADAEEKISILQRQLEAL